MPIAGHLHPVSEPARQVAHKLDCRCSAAVADPPGRDQLAIGAQSNPRPKVARIFRRGLRRHHVALFGVAECPDFIELDALAGQVAERLILIRRERFASIL